MSEWRATLPADPKPGDVVIARDGSRILIGDMNTLLGVCDDCLHPDFVGTVDGPPESNVFETISRLTRAIERLNYATRVREDYPLRCQRCGAPHWFDTTVPSEIWNRIVNRREGKEDDYGVLCVLCIDELVTALKLPEPIAVEFHYGGAGITGRMYDADMGTLLMLQRALSDRTAQVGRLRIILKRLLPITQHGLHWWGRETAEGWDEAAQVFQMAEAELDEASGKDAEGLVRKTLRVLETVLAAPVLATDRGDIKVNVREVLEEWARLTGGKQ